MISGLEELVKATAEKHGCLAGFTSTARLKDAPPSGDPEYLLPGAKSVIALALPLRKEHIHSFLTKESWNNHCENRKEAVKRLYTLGDTLVKILHDAGYSSVNVDINNNYRPEAGAADVTEMTDFLPEFSHRYAAVAAGIGRLGWSGNLMTPKYGALVELGSVITTAPLTPDALIPDAEHPCDGCRMCSAVCPVEMVPAKSGKEVQIAGLVEHIAEKQPNTCCWIGCTGYEGLSSSEKWSNWSPYRLDKKLPATKNELDTLCIALQKLDPQMENPDNSFADYRNAVFNPDWFYYTVCGFCRLVCWKEKRKRLQNRRDISESGRAALGLDGTHVRVKGAIVEIPTPFGVTVAIPEEDFKKRKLVSRPEKALFPLDREVIRYIQNLPL